MYRIFSFILILGLSLPFQSGVYAVMNTQPSQSSLDTFRELDIELTEDIADTYFVGDAILIHGRVTDNRSHALIFLKNTETGESISELADTESGGFFQIPLSLPSLKGKYSLIIASGNSFKTSVHKNIILVENKPMPVASISQIIHPNIVYGNSPYLFFGTGLWANMTIEQGKKITKSQGTVLSLLGLPISSGPAKVSLWGYTLSSPSSLDRVASAGFIWMGSIYMDRERDIIGKNLVTLRISRSTETMQFRIKKGQKVSSIYYLTTPNGDVIEYYFPQKYRDIDGFLRTGVLIQDSFEMPDDGIYKIETVQNNGYAYFNLPISKGPFWSIVAPLSNSQKYTIRKDLAIVTTSVLDGINKLRIGLGGKTLSIDPILSDLAQKKATDMAIYDYVGHTTHGGMNIIEFAGLHNIHIMTSIGENVAGGNVSDMSLQDGLEESGSHRSNMIDPDWKHVGVGYVTKNGKTYLVEIFGE